MSTDNSPARREALQGRLGVGRSTTKSMIAMPGSSASPAAGKANVNEAALYENHRRSVSDSAETDVRNCSREMTGAGHSSRSGLRTSGSLSMNIRTRHSLADSETPDSSRAAGEVGPHCLNSFDELRGGGAFSSGGCERRIELDPRPLVRSLTGS
jgi:hypothetical protein